MAGIVMNASKNEEFVKENEGLMESVHRNEDGSSNFSADSSMVKGAYIPPEEAAKLLEMFKTSVVQDFEDDYHLTKQEREEIQQRYEKFFKLKKGFTRKIRKLDKFVQAYRLCLEIIDDIAATNGIYSPEKFRTKALNGSIQIEGLNFPKFQGKKKKKINWEHVAEYIFDPTKDIRELTEAEEVAKETQHVTSSILTEEDVDRILQPQDTWEEDLEDYRAIVGKIGGSIAGEMEKKEQKWLAKKCPQFIQYTQDSAKMDGSSARAKMHVYDTDDTELELIRAYDNRIIGKSTLDEPTFSGDFNDTDAVDAYLFALDEYEKQTTFVSYNGRMITEEKAEELEYIGQLEAAGWNVRNLYDNRDKDKQIQKAEKADKKRVAALREMLSVAQLKEKLRKKGFDEKEIDEYIKKRNEQGNKNKKKKKKAKKAMEGVILDATKSKHKNFKKYRKEMERM